MKFLVTFWLFLALSNAQNACEFCVEGTGKIIAALASNESLNLQQEYLINNICLQEDDAFGCAAEVLLWWRRMSEAIYVDGADGFVCHQLDPNCQAPFFKL